MTDEKKDKRKRKRARIGRDGRVHAPARDRMQRDSAHNRGKACDDTQSGFRED